MDPRYIDSQIPDISYLDLFTEADLKDDILALPNATDYYLLEGYLGTTFNKFWVRPTIKYDVVCENEFGKPSDSLDVWETFLGTPTPLNVTVENIMTLGIMFLAFSILFTPVVSVFIYDGT